MKTIIFIGTNKSGSSYDAIIAAENMHYYTVLLTDREEMLAEKRSEFPHVHLMKLCNIDNINEIRSAINGLTDKYLDIYAIISFVDPYCYTASILAHEYRLKYFTSEAILIMMDKIKSREILDGSPYVPFFYKIDDNTPFFKSQTEGKLPLVLKIPSSAGSKNVYKVLTYWQYQNTVDELRRNYPKEPILAEEYMEGPQYLVETVTINQKVNIIAIIEQEITFTGRFIVTGYKMILEHENENEFYRSLKEAVNFIIDRHGMKNGPCHLEMKYAINNTRDKNTDKWRLIEANPRISGGAMNSFIETAYGINLVKETLRLAIGNEPDFTCKYKKETFLQYVIVPKAGRLIKVTGRNNAMNCRGVEQVYIKPKKDSIIIPPVSMAYRYAYVIATGKTSGDAMENAKYGASKIKFHLREIDPHMFSQFTASEIKVLNIAEKNKPELNKIDNFFNNYIFYDQYDR